MQPVVVTDVPEWICPVSSEEDVRRSRDKLTVAVSPPAIKAPGVEYEAAMNCQPTFA